MKKNNKYERAFEAYMQFLGLPCLGTREQKRNLIDENLDDSLKNFDFIVSSHQLTAPKSWSENAGTNYLNQLSLGNRESSLPPTWLIDIKGRKFPSGHKSPQYWRNWIAEEDLLCLTRWESFFGLNFHGLFVFVYDVCGPKLPVPEHRLFTFEGSRYAFFAIPLIIYRDHKRNLSHQWQTVTMPTDLFRKYAVSLDEFFK